MSTKLESKILLRVKRATKKYSMLEPGDRVMVCMSGGKDSYTLLDMMEKIRAILPFDISLVAVNLDQGHPGFPQEVLPNYLEARGVEYEIVKRNTLAVVQAKVPEGNTYCALCARLRRGILYNKAVELGCTKIALGHHRDDVIETALLNLLYGGKIAAMPPVLRSEDGRNTVIRPLMYVPEEWIVEYSAYKEYPIIPCGLCGSQDNLQRQKIKALLKELDDENPFVKRSMMGALANVVPTHLHDERLWELAGVQHSSQEPDPLAEIEGGCGSSGITPGFRDDLDLPV